jgi:prepilin signal peptidase PulO-like enzyme (type II secretory pathway)
MEIYLVLGIYFFIIGACFGSFMNMLVWRVHTGENIGHRSYCDHTKKPLGVIDLIPIVSFIMFKGKCRDCGKKLSPLYPVIETLTGLLSLLIFIVISNNVAVLDFGNLLLHWAILFSMVFTIMFFGYYDYLHWEVDLKSIYVALGFVGILNVINIFTPLPYFAYWSSQLLGGLLLAGIILLVFLISKGGGMGEGDIYLFGLVGLMLGINGGLLAFFLAITSGALVGIVKAINLRKLRKVKIQLAPFIALGTIVALLFQNQILNWYWHLF